MHEDNDKLIHLYLIFLTIGISHPYEKFHGYMQISFCFDVAPCIFSFVFTSFSSEESALALISVQLKISTNISHK